MPKTHALLAKQRTRLDSREACLLLDESLYEKEKRDNGDGSVAYPRPVSAEFYHEEAAAAGPQQWNVDPPVEMPSPVASEVPQCQDLQGPGRAHQPKHSRLLALSLPIALTLTLTPSPPPPL